jgi:hypothetical protein
MADFKMPDIAELMQAAQQMQEQLKKRRVEGSAGGGMVTVVMTGELELVALKIDPAVVDPKDVGMLQDLVIAAINQAREKLKTEMAALTGGMVPGMPSIG